MVSYIYKVIITTETPFNISTGVKNNSFIKDMSVRDMNGKPYIPGSTIKGEMRANFNKLNGEEKTKELFGDKFNKASKVIVDNFYAHEDRYETSIRYGNAIDRFRRVAKEKALFSKEVVSGTFIGEIEVLFDEKEIDKDDIYLAIKMITAIGGSKSSGLGRINIDIEEVKL